jgi:hypothetical protein
LLGVRMFFPFIRGSHWMFLNRVIQTDGRFCLEYPRPVAGYRTAFSLGSETNPVIFRDVANIEVSNQRRSAREIMLQMQLHCVNWPIRL